jgi:peroxiredoxin
LFVPVETGPMLARGDEAPSFTLTGTDGDEIREYSLADHLDTGPVVLAFYPQDFSPACTEELCTLHEGDYFSFVPGVDVFGISTDGVYSHREFVEKHGIGFPLLSDGDGVVAERYDARYETPHEELGARVVKRSLYLVDAEGTIQYAWQTDDVREIPDLLDAKARLDEITA